MKFWRIFGFFWCSGAFTWRAVFCLLLFSCSAFESLRTKQHYSIAAPPLPEAWQRQSALTLLGWDGHILKLHSLANGSWEWERQELLGLGLGSIGVELGLQESALILLYPRFAELPERFTQLWYPAGTALLWEKWGAEEASQVVRQLAARWFTGFSTTVLWHLVEGGFDIRYLNIAKLDSYLEKRVEMHEGDFAPNPWRYDESYLVAQIASLDADWYDIRLRNKPGGASGGGVDLPADFWGKTWQALDTARPSWKCESSCTVDLAQGLHYLWAQETRELWELDVGRNGALGTWRLFGPGGGGS